MCKAPGFDGTQPCASLSGDMFFPDSAAETTKIRPQLNKICNSCQFQAPCLQYSLEHSVSGVWAGTIENERRAMRRRLNIVPKTVTIKI